jgi:hypothetical protein
LVAIDDFARDQLDMLLAALFPKPCKDGFGDIADAGERKIAFDPRGDPGIEIPK